MFLPSSCASPEEVDIADLQLDTNANGRCSISVTAHIRITLADGTYHEDIGHGSGENLKGKASALEKVSYQVSVDRTIRYTS